MFQRDKGVAHGLSVLAKGLAVLLVFVFSMSLGFMYFQSIAPASMPWFTASAMGLTEIGLVLWLIEFAWAEHHSTRKSIAIGMVVATLTMVLFTDAVELARLTGTAFLLNQFYFIALIVMLCVHMVALIGGIFSSYFSHPHHPWGPRQTSQTFDLVRTSQTGTTVLPESVEPENFQLPEIEERQKTPAYVVRTTNYPPFMAKVMRQLTGNNYHPRNCTCASCRQRRGYNPTFVPNSVTPDESSPDALPENAATLDGNK